jgi:hypothetical protein
MSRRRLDVMNSLLWRTDKVDDGGRQSSSLVLVGVVANSKNSQHSAAGVRSKGMSSGTPAFGVYQ